MSLYLAKKNVLHSRIFFMYYIGTIPSQLEQNCESNQQPKQTEYYMSTRADTTRVDDKNKLRSK